MSERELFENWYGTNCTDDERSRMLEMRDGNYIFMQARSAWTAFEAGMRLSRLRGANIEKALR